jgi:hypothetical protein
MPVVILPIRVLICAKEVIASMFIEDSVIAAGFILRILSN